LFATSADVAAPAPSWSEAEDTNIESQATMIHVDVARIKALSEGSESWLKKMREEWKILLDDTSNMKPMTKAQYMMQHEHILYDQGLASALAASVEATPLAPRIQYLPFDFHAFVMSAHASVLVNSVGPPSAEVCRAAASFP
jgi:hypothetical protein